MEGDGICSLENAENPSLLVHHRSCIVEIFVAVIQERPVQTLSSEEGLREIQSPNEWGPFVYKMGAQTHLLYRNTSEKPH